MISPNNLQERLDQLGRDLQRQPSVADTILSQLEPHQPRAVRLHWWNNRRARAILSFATVACLILVAASFALRPSTLYARAMDALSRVQTIHVTGWTSQVARSWQLEQDDDSTEQQANAQKRHDVDMWFWQSIDGTSRGYERNGPVTKSQIGQSVQEYQQDADLLYLAEGRNSDTGKRFASLASYLRSLDGATQEDLGTRNQDGVAQRGVRVSRHNRVDEYWFDAKTDLPVSFSRTQDGKLGFELHFAYNQQVPDEVTTYAVPHAKTVRYGGQHENVNVVWKQHVQDLWQTKTPLDDTIRIVERKRSFDNQWSMQTPDGKFWVVPIDRDQHERMNVDHFLRLAVSKSNSDRESFTWRVADKELLDIEFPRCDLIYADGTPWHEWVQAYLHTQGLEFSDVTEQRTHWVAKHDGRELKPWQEVNPPVPYLMRNGEPRIGVVRTGIGKSGSPETLLGLFRDFNTTQNASYQADHPIIVDHTGLPRMPKWNKEEYPSYRQYYETVVKKYLVSSDSPHFNGDAGRKMARDWYAKEFGITFEPEQRPVTVHVIKKK